MHIPLSIRRTYTRKIYVQKAVVIRRRGAKTPNSHLSSETLKSDTSISHGHNAAPRKIPRHTRAHIPYMRALLTPKFRASAALKAPRKELLINAAAVQPSNDCSRRESGLNSRSARARRKNTRANEALIVRDNTGARSLCASANLLHTRPAPRGLEFSLALCATRLERELFLCRARELFCFVELMKEGFKHALVGVVNCLARALCAGVRDRAFLILRREWICRG